MTESRNQRLRRARPVFALAAVAFVVGAIFGAGHAASPSNALASRFVTQWTNGDYASMYSEIDATSRHATSAGEFAGAYEAACGPRRRPT